MVEKGVIKHKPDLFQRLFVFSTRVVVLGLDFLVLVLQCVASVWYLGKSFLWPQKEKEFSGEVAVVTGGAKGIGRELVRQLVGLGVRVAVWDRDKVELDVLVEELKGEVPVVGVLVDVSGRDAVARAASYTRKMMGEVTLLFNNAGIMPCKPLLSFKEGEVEQVFSVNVFSQFHTIQEFLPRMLNMDRGHIVSISSMAGVIGTANLVPYCASKFALKGMMESLFLELRQNRPDSKVKLTTIHPFTVTTGLAQKPRTRFSSLIPFTSASEAARQVISAARRDLEYSFIPAQLCITHAFLRAIPRAAQLAILDFLDCSVDPHDD